MLMTINWNVVLCCKNNDSLSIYLLQLVKYGSSNTIVANYVDATNLSFVKYFLHSYIPVYLQHFVVQLVYSYYLLDWKKHRRENLR